MLVPGINCKPLTSLNSSNQQNLRFVNNSDIA